MQDAHPRPSGIDAWLTLKVFRRLTRKTTSLGPRIPILMYHSVSATPSGQRHPYFETNVTPERFTEHVHILARRGYETLTIGTIVERLLNPRARDNPAVAITFDDGYADVYNTAWPILRSAGMTATVFLPTTFIQDLRQSMAGRPCLTWSEVRELAAAGIEFGSHSVTHPQLHDVDGARLANEIVNSAAAIAQQLGKPCDGFSYPYAYPAADRDFCRQLRSLLKTSGYAWGVTTTIATARHRCDRFALPRLPVNNRDTADLFAAKLDGAYDWLGTAQSTSKFLRSLMTAR